MEFMGKETSGDVQGSAIPNAQGYNNHKHTLRHISGIHVRNLTPFPQRDRVASALQHRAPISAQRDTTHVADDLDLLSRKRTRRVSSASVATVKTLRSDRDSSEAMDLVSEETILRSNRSPRVRPSLKSPGSHQYTTPQTTRARSSSNASSRMLSPPPKPILVPFRGAATTSQRDLEKVVESRLLETFVAISIPSDLESSGSQGLKLASIPMTSTTSSRKDAPPSSSRRSVSQPSRGVSPSPSPRASRNQIGRSGATSTSTQATSVHFPSSITKGTAPSTSPQYGESRIEDPVFLSPFHRPSTNPSWSSLNPEDDFTEGVDLSTSYIHVTLWGHSPNSTPPMTTRASLKGKEKAHDPLARAWKVLVEWDVQLDQLKPLAPDFESTTEMLPPNSLVFSINPSGTLFYLPSSNLSDRSSSPQGHVSDGELDVKTGTARHRPSHESISHAEARQKSLRETRMKAGASWQDILKLATLQSCVQDTKNSLEEVVQSIDGLVYVSGPLEKIRTAGEYEHRIRILTEQRAAIADDARKSRSSIEHRKAALAVRRSTLSSGRKFHSEDCELADEIQLHVPEQKKQLLSVLQPSQTRRTSLLRIVDIIFPIEPISSADLLFSILDVPLPIPVNPSDPAPPLTDPTRPTLNINEDTIATSLGYTAQVVHLVALYMGSIIPYPITYAGSRSLIKDPISSMHGPRTFPLYSKGVDTYRFEYAVFLLNKDIEMLMTERNLRAMDMRHTLPNLKNLLLTLTDGAREDETLKRRLVPTNVPTPVPPSAPTTPNGIPTVPSSSTPSPQRTPTAKKPFLSPIAGFWRSRYASRTTPTAVPETPEPEPEATLSESNGTSIHANGIVSENGHVDHDSFGDAENADVTTLESVMANGDVIAYEKLRGGSKSPSIPGPELDAIVSLP